MCCSNMCYTCLRNDCKELADLSALDSDKISYLDKLKSCLGVGLQPYDRMVICVECIAQLRITYQFMELLKLTQVTLQEFTANMATDYTENKQPESNEELKLEYESQHSDSSDSFLSDLKVHKDDSDSDSAPTELPPPESPQEEKEEAKTYNCEYCEVTFAKRWQLQKHRQRLHLAEKKFVCTFCNKAFKQSYHLSEHIRAHTGERIYECNYCDKKFHRVSSHKRHERSHNAAPGKKTKKTPFLCTVCGKSFPFSNGVQRHMRVHLGIRSHECNICHRKFNQSTHLHTHMRTHTGEKPYVCHSCGDAFSLKCQLQKHLLKHEEDVREKAQSTGGVEYKMYVTINPRACV